MNFFIEPLITEILSATLVFARISMILLVLPGLDAGYFPARYRISTALVFSIAIFGSLSDELPYPDTSSEAFWGIFFSELVVGGILGICIRSIIFCLQILGAIIAQSVSLSQILGASISTDAQSTVSNVLVLSGLAIAMMSGLLEYLLIGLSSTYQMIPAGYPLAKLELLKIVGHTYRVTLEMALQLSTPFLLLAIYYNSILAVVNRAMPQLLVSFIGVPAILILALLLLTFGAGHIISIWSNWVFELLKYLGF